MSHSEEKTTLALYVHKDTAKAWLVDQQGKETMAVWLPKSQCTMVEERAGKHPIEADIEIPNWLIEKKGFV